jgi:putative radical SAM enzyme (TIGR03279 family)
MPRPQVLAVAPSSPAQLSGVCVGDEIASMNGSVPRDVIEYQIAADEAVVELELVRGGLEVSCVVEKQAGEPLGIEVSSAVFDRVRTCDNHCAFCFIYQLPKGMRRSLYVKDDDYRLSFLYGNFTTLTRFTEADLERVITEHLSPLFVSIHATDPAVRATLLRNPRGAMSLRWLSFLLEAGIEVHGQIVVCPGINDGAVLEDTLAGILERFPGLKSAAAVPLGVSRFSKEATMRPHTVREAIAVLETVHAWQEIFREACGRRLIFAADEYYLLAGRPFPELSEYEDLAQQENGVGMARVLIEELRSGVAIGTGATHGFFQSVDGAPAAGYRAKRVAGAIAPRPRSSRDQPVTVITGVYGAAVLEPALAAVGRDDVRLLVVENHFFGGNIAVTGLMTGEDLRRVLAAELARSPKVAGRYLLPDVCLSEGRFVDGMTLEDLPLAVEVVKTDGVSLARALARRRSLLSAHAAPVLVS